MFSYKFTGGKLVSTWKIMYDIIYRARNGRYKIVSLDWSIDDDGHINYGFHGISK